MKIAFWYIGKTRENWVEVSCEDYLRKIRKYHQVETEEIPNIKNRANLPVNEVKKLEGEQVIKRLKTQDYLILLDEKGKKFTSVTFAQSLEKLLTTIPGRIIFLVGGAYGFDQSVYETTSQRISLSSLTFPHQLVRVIFLEQLYRAFSILNNDPYHHE